MTGVLRLWYFALMLAVSVALMGAWVLWPMMLWGDGGLWWSVGIICLTASAAAWKRT
jgi:hypothetical protein